MILRTDGDTVTQSPLSNSTSDRQIELLIFHRLFSYIYALNIICCLSIYIKDAYIQTTLHQSKPMHDHEDIKRRVYKNQCRKQAINTYVSITQHSTFFCAEGYRATPMAISAHITQPIRAFTWAHLDLNANYIQLLFCTT